MSNFPIDLDECAVPLEVEQKYFDLECGKKNIGMSSKHNIVGLRKVSQGKFMVDAEFFEKIARIWNVMEKHVSVGAYFSPEELIGFYTWSEMSDYEKNMAILVLKQLAKTEYETLVEVGGRDGICFKFDPAMIDSF